MQDVSRARGRMLGAVVALSGLLALGAPPAQAKNAPLQWEACGDAPGIECAAAEVPKDWRRVHGEQWKVAVTRSPATDQANRIGALFFNFGGPGAPAAAYVEAYGAALFPELNKRFDIIGVDPRGTGGSTPTIDCKVNQEEQGVYSQPFATALDTEIGDLVAKIRTYVDACVAQTGWDAFKYVSTADVARDIDSIRRRLGEEQLTYLGYSYGTFLGATYAGLFPDNYRALVLDGPLDADAYINDPLQSLAEQTAGFERALGRFFQACAADQQACSGFGGTDPWSAYDELVDQANASPIPAPGYAPDPRPVDGDDINAVATSLLYAKPLWGTLGAALAAAAGGDASQLRQIVDERFYGRDPETGQYDPSTDRYFTLGATEQRYPRDLRTYVEAGDRSWGQNEHFWFNNGLVELNWALFPVDAKRSFRGPFRIPERAAPALVVATRYDPATPYRGALRLVRQLGNARLLTMIGDGHTAYPGNSACVDAAVEAYLLSVTLPAPNAKCRQEVPFTAPAAPADAQTQRAASGERLPTVRPHVKPLVLP